MRIIQPTHPEDFKSYSTEQIRQRYLLDKLVQADKVECTYTHYDRMIIGAAHPVNTTLELGTYDQLKSDFFLTRREMGIISIAGNGTITVDGVAYQLEKLDCLYIGKGDKKVTFSSADAASPAKFIFFSCPAHHEYPVQMMKPSDATPAEMGSSETANHRVINKYIHPDGLKSCQLMLGVTNFKPGSLWNTMAPHLHDRRMEAYFYFNLPENQRVLHLMGEPNETRHMFINNEEGIVSPSWSIHSGVGTAAYSFIWAMAGENASFTDMDPVNISTLK
jgi:4-deoxy-L-threo-5-hexosulose-uronate ketol-isomerase